MPGAPARGPSTRDTILSVLRALPDDEAVAERIVNGACSTGASWQRLIDDATAHGVLAIMSPVLARAPMPDAIKTDVERRLAVQTAWQAHARASLATIVAPLTAASVRVCALKGPALAERFYSRPEQRPSMDLDLLVTPGDLGKASAALTAAGYSGDMGSAESYLLEHGHHVHFSRRGQPDVELHFRAYAGFGVVLPASALLDRAHEHRLDEELFVMVPSPEDEFLYLSVHAAGHSFIRLLWLYDLKLLLRRNRLDWAAVDERARDAGLVTAVAYSARLLREWLDVRIPLLHPREHLRVRLAHRLLGEVSRPSTPGPRDNLGGLLFTSMLCDRVSASGWLLQHHLLRTTRRRLRRLAPRLLPERWAG